MDLEATGACSRSEGNECGGGSSEGLHHSCKCRGEFSGRVLGRQWSMPGEKVTTQSSFTTTHDSGDDFTNNSSNKDKSMVVQTWSLIARTILRSKLYISHRSSRPTNSGMCSSCPPSTCPVPGLSVKPIRRRSIPPSTKPQQKHSDYSPPLKMPRSGTALEGFFDRLVLAHENSSLSPSCSSPVLGPVASWSGIGGERLPDENRECVGRRWDRWREAMTLNSGPSIVERNARIITWLCDCRKAQQCGDDGHSSGSSVSFPAGTNSGENMGENRIAD